MPKTFPQAGCSQRPLPFKLRKAKADLMGTMTRPVTSGITPCTRRGVPQLC